METFSTTQQPTPGNGLVTIIRQTAPYYRLNLNPPLQALAIRTQLHMQYTVCNIYISPNEVIPPDSLTQLINQLPHPFLLLGDFNGKHPIWGCNSSDWRGAIVEAAVNDTNSCILNMGTSTHIHLQLGQQIDLSRCCAGVYLGGVGGHSWKCPLSHLSHGLAHCTYLLHS